MKNCIAIVLVLIYGSLAANTCFTDGVDLLKAASSVIDETARQSYSGQGSEKKISYASVLPEPDEKNVVITFTINSENKIHVVEVQGGYALINHYIKSSLEGKVIKTDNAIPGINYVMTVKLPASA